MEESDDLDDIDHEEAEKITEEKPELFHRP